MCVTAWSSLESPEGQRPLQNGIEIIHFEEAIAPGTDCHQIDILATVLVRVKTPQAFLHLVHRRCVEIEIATDSVLHPEDNFARALSVISPLASVPGDASKKYFDWSPPVAATGDLPPEINVAPVRALLVHNLKVTPDIGGVRGRNPEEISETPYTSVSFGPLPSTEDLCLLRARLHVADPGFTQLIRQVNAYGVQYHHDMQGPETVWRDIEQLDLRSLRPEAGAPFLSRYRWIAENNCRLQIPSYSILTFDVAQADTGYNRAYAWTERTISDELPTVGGKRSEYRVNGWHSTNPRFVIQRVVFADRVNSGSQRPTAVMVGSVA